MHGWLAGVLSVPRNTTFTGTTSLVPVLVTESPNTLRGTATSIVPLGVSQNLSTTAFYGQTVSVVPLGVSQNLSTTAFYGQNVSTVTLGVTEGEGALTGQTVSVVTVGLNRTGA